MLRPAFEGLSAYFGRHIFATITPDSAAIAREKDEGKEDAQQGSISESDANNNKHRLYITPASAAEQEDKKG
ncbi:hypothetical protein E2C01_094737 [Portunus trituberculatus]|uniref:Uncharacterized protein n=1 Tax=Portunus trituberculatus TaxID=210409 RepID=A0A5B7JR86_PORTR|nr:hypothetical protein [Portunus trituberculatus]